MSYKALQAFKIKDYKCFDKDQDYQGFDEIKPINIIIGKNNSGKSKILEFFQNFVKKNQERNLLKIEERILIRKTLEEDELKKVFSPNSTNGPIGQLGISHYSSNNHWKGVGSHLLGKNIEYADEDVEILNHGFNLSRHAMSSAFVTYQKKLKDHLKNPLFGYDYISIKAERDLKKEKVNFSSQIQYKPQPDGGMLTNILVRCLNEERGHDAGWQQLVEDKLLDKINSVLAPDICFTRINAKTDTNDQWEIFLEEEHKGGIKLSDCGSGLKTIIFVMTALYVAPEFLEQDKLIFFFEELENNLHPSLERKLLAHIRDYILENEKHLLFLTTHSNVAIDMFNNYEAAQIVRVYNDGKSSFIEKADNWNKHHNLLNELGVKASDVLQSNCIVWLEGPSDRIYFNKWVELFNDGELLEEGLHYQCVFYGGAILSHYSAAAPNDDNFIQMLRINRNAIVLMDSDKTDSESDLKERVKRILSEAEDKESILAWVTEGREIENYLPDEILTSFLGKGITLGRYHIFANKFKSSKEVETFDKVKFAADVTQQDYYTRGALEGHLDLRDRMFQVIEHIRNCNS